MTSAQQAQVAASVALAQMQGNQGATSMATAISAITSRQQFIINSFKGKSTSATSSMYRIPVYDTITYPPSATINTTNSQFFSNVGALSGKTLAQTNMAQTQKLDAPGAFPSAAIRLAFSEDILRSDVQTLLNSWAYTFTLGQKWYQRANIRHFAAGWGLFGTTTKTNEAIYNNGIPSMQAMHGLAVKLVIANQMSFSADLDGSAGQVLSSSGSV